MTKLLKKIGMNSVLIAVFLCAAGIFLIVSPTANTACPYIIALGFGLFGAVSLISYIRELKEMDNPGYALGGGITAMIFAVFVIIRTTLIIEILPVIFGFIIILDGMLKLHTSFSVKRTGYTKWWYILIVSLIGVVYGIIIAFIEFKGAETSIIVAAGVGMIYGGVSDLVTTIIALRAIKVYKAGEIVVAQKAESEDK